MTAPEIVWRKGHITAEDLSGKRPFLLRFHESDQIPGPARSSCVIAQVDNFGAEVKAWGGRLGPTGEDRRAIAEFCQWQEYQTASWWRYKADRDPYQIWLYR